MRRRTWCVVIVLDVRASEDQGMDNSITAGSFDTKLPVNINDTDIEPEMTEMPKGREGVTDMTFPLVSFEICEATKQLMAQSIKDGSPVGIEEQSRLLNSIYEKVDKGYLQYTAESGNIVYWVAVTIARLVMAKITLLIYLPILFSSPGEPVSESIRSKLLVAAIEIAELNHALNAEQACRHWRWVYQTYTHWYAVVYLLIETARRPWSPMMERAWMALHSPWLIPAHSHMDKNLRIWVPLRKLTAKARKHRDAELRRLRADPHAAERLEMEDQSMPVPASPEPFPADSNTMEHFRERWHQLVVMPDERGNDTLSGVQSGFDPSAQSPDRVEPSAKSLPEYSESDLGSYPTLETAYLGARELPTYQNKPKSTEFQSTITTTVPGESAIGQGAALSYGTFPQVPPIWPTGLGPVPWMWADTDPSVDVFANVDMNTVDVNMDLDTEMDWYDWIESAKGLESETGPNFH